MKTKWALALGIFAILLPQGAFSQETFASRRRPYPVCDLASINNDILAAGLGHNSFDSIYRNPFGAVDTQQGATLLRFRTCEGDVTGVRIRLWNLRQNRETWIKMEKDPFLQINDPSLGATEYWSAAIPIPVEPTILYYFFEVSDSWNTQYYVADSSPLAHGGWGHHSVKWDDQSTYSISVFEQGFQTPDWLKGAVLYHVLPDRFRNGDPTNDPITGEGFVFGKTHFGLTWNTPLCDPRSAECPGQQDNQFYGGDLQGVVDKLDYLESLGVSALYFNPVFLSSTNHRYDTQDYYAIDPKLGTQQTFDTLVAQARPKGMQVILDGVFNHGSADSPYFDLFRRWNGTGACEAEESIYREWFYFPHFANEPVDHARPGNYYYCMGSNGVLTTYEAWWSYYEHPVYQKNSPVIRDYFFASGRGAVAPYWIHKGIGGWRLDVAGDVAPAEPYASTNDFWQAFRNTLKAEHSDAVIIGEEWSNATPFLLGTQWDSATNYRFRTLLLDWLADSCTGLGCSDGRAFEDDDNNYGSINGPIIPINEFEFDRRLRALQQDLPEEAWHVMMNPLGSHDTQRASFILKKTSSDNVALARQKLKLAALFQFTYPGVPVIYYGDEAGVQGDGRFYDGRFRDDPYNRVVYPWADQGLTPDEDMIAHFSRLGRLRKNSLALRRGGYKPILADNQKRLLAFERAFANERILIILNRNPDTNLCRLAVDVPAGTVFEDLLNQETFSAAQGTLDCGTLPGLWGRILQLKSP